MKVKNNKVAIFVVAGIALGSVGALSAIQHANNSLNNSSSVYAAEGNRVNVSVPSNSINIEGSTNNANSFTATFSGNITLPQEDINNGDYIDFVFRNFNAGSLQGRELRVDDEIIAKFGSVNVTRPNEGLAIKDLTLNGSLPTSTAKLIFNENAVKHKGKRLEINIKDGTILEFSSKDWNFNTSLEINGVKAGETTINMKKSDLSNGYGGRIWHGRFDLYSPDGGETFEGRHVGFGVLQQFKNENTQLKPGDVLTWEITNKKAGVSYGVTGGRKVGDRVTLQSGLPVNRGDNVNAHGVIKDDFDVPFVVQYKEISPYKVSVQIVSIPEVGLRGDVNAKSLIITKLLDTSTKTIDYAKNDLIPVATKVTVKRGKKAIYEYSGNADGKIDGSNLKAYSAISKRGSVIRKITDDKGNKIRGYETDIVVEDRRTVGTEYSVDAPEIKGYRFKGLGKDSDPRAGSIEEGVKEVVLEYVVDGKDQTIYVGDNPNPTTHIPGFDDQFEGCSAKYKTVPNTSKPGTVPAVVVISCPEGEDIEVPVNIHIKENPKSNTNNSGGDQLKAPNTGHSNITSPAILLVSAFSLISLVVAKKKK